VVLEAKRWLLLLLLLLPASCVRDFFSSRN